MELLQKVQPNGGLSTGGPLPISTPCLVHPEDFCPCCALPGVSRGLLPRFLWVLVLPRLIGRQALCAAAWDRAGLSGGPGTAPAVILLLTQTRDGGCLPRP